MSDSQPNFKHLEITMKDALMMAVFHTLKYLLHALTASGGRGKGLCEGVGREGEGRGENEGRGRGGKERGGEEECGGEIGKTSVCMYLPCISLTVVLSRYNFIKELTSSHPIVETMQTWSPCN